MSDDLAELAAWRQKRRAEGKPLHLLPEEIAELAQKKAATIAQDDARLEKEIQRDVRKLYIAYGCKVYWLSQARESGQTPGLGDLWVVHPRLRRAWWHETKKNDGKQSTAQVDFETECILCKVDYVLGGIQSAENQLVAIGAAERTPTGLEPVRQLTRPGG